MTITVETHVRAPIDKVWKAYTTADDIIQWNAASDDWHTPRASVDLRVGGQFSSRMEAKDGSVGFDFEGTYTEVVENRRLAYAFGERQASVDFDQTPDGVKVKVSFEPEDTFPLDQQRAGWQAILDRFGRYVEARG